MVLPKGNRLGVKDEIEIILKKGKVLKSDFFLIRYVFGDDQTRKFGISAGSRHFKKAVERNFVRRRLSEIIRNNILLIKPGLRAMIALKKNILTEETRKIEKILLEELAKARR